MRRLSSYSVKYNSSTTHGKKINTIINNSPVGMIILSDDNNNIYTVKYDHIFICEINDGDLEINWHFGRGHIVTLIIHILATGATSHSINAYYADSPDESKLKYIRNLLIK